MKVVFFGTPQFSADVLSYLIDNGINIVAVVTRTDKPKGRSGLPVHTPVKTFVLNKIPFIPLFQPLKVSSPEFSEVLPPFEADLFVVVAYGEILKQPILDTPTIGCINLHTSLLPKYRGAAPIQRAIIEGQIETGVTIMHMVRTMDAGDIIKTIKVPIGANDTFGEVEQNLCKKGSPLLLEAIHDLERGKSTRIPQDESQITFAPKIELEDCAIDWKRSAEEIHNLVRGVNPYPGAWCHVNVKGEIVRLKIKSTHQATEEGKPGALLSTDPQSLLVGCGKGSIKILELQLEGKRAMTPSELLRGTSLAFVVN